MVFGVATFAPVPVPYPSRLPLQKYVLSLIGGLWGAVVLWYLIVPGVSEFYLVLTLVFPVYYHVLPLFHYEQLK